MPKCYMDRFESPLNPCSVETIPFPLELADGRKVWPVSISCYELRGKHRVGGVSLFMIRVPDVAHDLKGTPLYFPAKPDVVIQSSSGILDGHWRCFDEGYLLATAHSSGDIQIHALELFQEDYRIVDSDQLVSMNFVCSTFDDPITNQETAATHLCLSVNWDNESSRLVATYSDGHMAVYDYVQLENNKASLIEVEAWGAHSLFKVPSEVWSASFVDKDLVFSGGDDSVLKVWDIRATSRPVQTLNCFEAGVTCISAHKAVGNLVAAGSYDEMVRLFDVRFMSDRTPLFKTKPLGGGIWRMKWHPITPNRMLVAAMHGGCRVLNFGGGSFDCLEGALSWSNSKDSSFASSAAESFYNPQQGEKKVRMKCKRTKEFTEHESMAYGADWLVCPHPTRNGYFEAAARTAVHFTTEQCFCGTQCFDVAKMSVQSSLPLSGNED